MLELRDDELTKTRQRRAEMDAGTSLFRPAGGGSGPTSFDIAEPGAWLHALAEVSARHRVAVVGEDGVDGRRGGSSLMSETAYDRELRDAEVSQPTPL